MALSGDSNDSSVPARERRAAATQRSTASPGRRAPADEALRLAVELLSAEICWFFATDANARGAVVAAATDPS